MKKFTGVLLMIFVGLLIISGCSKPASDDLESDRYNDESIVDISELNDEISYAKLIPDPQKIFVNGKINVTDPDGGTAYFFEITNYNDGEFNTYVSECKKLGFTDISYDEEKQFGAYSSDGKYWADANLDGDKKIIYISCRESEKE